MTLIIGGPPPLHRRFDEATSLEAIRNRYRALHPVLANQVKVLQDDVETRIVFRSFYDEGYKDWHLVSAIFNIRMNWHFDYLRRPLPVGLNSEKLKELKEAIGSFVERPARFANEELIKLAITTFDMSCLASYGFECRRSDYDSRAVKTFLRERMRHYDLDLPHQLLFGKPLGYWPDYHA